MFPTGGYVMQWGVSSFASATSGTITVPYSAVGIGLSVVNATVPQSNDTSLNFPLIQCQVTGKNTFDWKSKSISGFSNLTSFQWMAIGTL